MVEDAAARYPVTIDPLAHQAYLKASNTGAGDFFGHSVALSGDTAVIGAPYEDSAATGVNGNQASNATADAGAAYVFVRDGGVWTFQAYLKASNTDTGDYFGYSVALDGNTAVIGARYEDSAATGVNGDQTSNAAAFSGAAYVFVRSGSTWSQQAYLKASNTGEYDSFGVSVALDGNTAVIGAPAEDSAAIGVNGDQTSNAAPGAGSAYVFVRSGSTWSQQAYLKATNTGEDDAFGHSVAVSGSQIAVGAPLEDSEATGVGGDQTSNAALYSGAVYLFSRNLFTGSWSQRYLKASNTGRSDYFGSSLALSGLTLLVGAPGESSAATGVNGNQNGNTAIASGAAYVFTLGSGVLGQWRQQAYLKASNTGASDGFGSSVALDGNTAVIGASSEDSAATGMNGNQADNSSTESGAAYVFTRVGTSWGQQAYLKGSNTPLEQTFGEFFGRVVAFSGDTVLAGAFGDNSAATGINGNQSDTSARQSGAAHVFTGFAPPPFRITGLLSVRNPNNSLTVTLSGTGQGTTSHTLQSSPGMAPGTWLGVGTTMSDAEGNFTFGPFVEPASRTRYFYRVGVD
ncbi:MAG: FG-GAP repeat protein [Verrucomicrobiota bacterium]